MSTCGSRLSGDFTHFALQLRGHFFSPIFRYDGLTAMNCVCVSACVFIPQFALAMELYVSHLCHHFSPCLCPFPTSKYLTHTHTHTLRLLQVVAHRNAVSADRQDMEEQQNLRSPMQTPFGKGTDTSTLPNIPRKGKPKSRSHRRSSWFDAGTIDLYGERRMLVHAKENLSRHIFEVEGIQPIKRLGCNQFGKYFVLFLPTLSLALLMWGASITAFTFDIQGVAGFFQEFGHRGSRTTPYSLLDVTRRLLVQASKTSTESSVGIHYIAVLYVLFAFIVPVCQLVGLIVIWVVPMTLSRMKRVFFGLEVRGVFILFLIF